LYRIGCRIERPDINLNDVVARRKANGRWRKINYDRGGDFEKKLPSRTILNLE